MEYLESQLEERKRQLAELQHLVEAGRKAHARFHDFPSEPAPGVFNCPRCWMFDGQEQRLQDRSTIDRSEHECPRCHWVYRYFYPQGQ